jgi:hypothetical protein
VLNNCGSGALKIQNAYHHHNGYVTLCTFLRTRNVPQDQCVQQPDTHDVQARNHHFLHPTLPSRTSRLQQTNCRFLNSSNKARLSFSSDSAASLTRFFLALRAPAQSPQSGHSASYWCLLRWCNSTGFAFVALGTFPGDSCTGRCLSRIRVPK